MKVLKFIFNGFGENTYIVYDPKTKECAIIDPGMSDAQERNAISDAIKKYGLIPKHLINTHLHVDHVIGNSYIENEFNLPVEAHKSDEFLSTRIREQARMFGVREDVKDTSIGTYLNDGDIIRVGDETLKVLSVPGHSPGSIALYCAESGFVITGDALFARSVGRTDLPGGDFHTLINSINTKLLTLPDNTVVLPGHGPETTIGRERESNPYL